MQQYFIEGEIKLNDIIVFNKDQSNHIQKVMRMDVDEIVKVVDTSFNPFLAYIKYRDKEVYAIAFEGLERKEEAIEITLIQGMIKKEKWEFLIQKCCELGVSKIIPLISSRTIVKIDANDKKKLERYNKIALEACEQCKRDSIVEICEPIKMNEIEKYSSQLNIVAYENAEYKSSKLKDVLNRNEKIKNITYVIGSEGGFSSEEIERLKTQGFLCVSLGERILRAETAAMSVVDVTRYHLG